MRIKPRISLHLLLLSIPALMILFIAYLIYAIINEEKLATEACIKEQKKATSKAAKLDNTVEVQTAFTKTDFGWSGPLTKENYSNNKPFIEIYSFKVPIEDEETRIKHCRNWAVLGVQRRIQKQDGSFYLIDWSGLYKLEGDIWQQILNGNDFPKELRRDNFYLTGTQFPAVLILKQSFDDKLVLIIHLGNDKILAVFREQKWDFYNWDFEIKEVVFDPTDSNKLYLITSNPYTGQPDEIYQLDLIRRQITKKFIGLKYLTSLNIVGDSIYVVTEIYVDDFKIKGDKLLKINKINGSVETINKEGKLPADFRPEFYSVNTSNPKEIIIADENDNIYFTKDQGATWTKLNDQRLDPNWHRLLFDILERRIIVENHFKELKINKNLGEFQILSVD